MIRIWCRVRGWWWTLALGLATVSPLRSHHRTESTPAGQRLIDEEHAANSSDRCTDRPVCYGETRVHFRSPPEDPGDHPHHSNLLRSRRPKAVGTTYVRATRTGEATTWHRVDHNAGDLAA